MVRLIRFLTVLVGAFALYQFFYALMFASRQQWPFAGLYAVMAIAGGALARALWLNKRKLSRPPE